MGFTITPALVRREMQQCFRTIMAETSTPEQIASAHSGLEALYVTILAAVADGKPGAIELAKTVKEEAFR